MSMIIVTFKCHGTSGCPPGAILTSESCAKWASSYSLGTALGGGDFSPPMGSTADLTLEVGMQVSWFWRCEFERAGSTHRGLCGGQGKCRSNDIPTQVRELAIPAADWSTWEGHIPTSTLLENDGERAWRHWSCRIKAAGSPWHRIKTVHLRGVQLQI